MKVFTLLFLVLTFCLSKGQDSNKLQWIEINHSADWEEVIHEAESTNQNILIYFSGSDWCAKCSMLKKNVFTNKSFIEKANNNWILVNIDFPQRTQLSKETIMAREALAEEYNAEGSFPKLVLINESKDIITQIKGYQDVHHILNKLK